MVWPCLGGLGGFAFGGAWWSGVVVQVWCGWFCFWGRLVVWGGCALLAWVVLLLGALGGLVCLCLGGLGGFAFGGGWVGWVGFSVRHVYSDRLAVPGKIGNFE